MFKKADYILYQAAKEAGLSFTGDINYFLLAASDEEFEKLMTTIREKFHSIISNISPRHEGAVFLYFLLRKGREIRKWLRNPPDDVFTVISLYVEEAVKSSVSFHLDLPREKVLELMRHMFVCVDEPGFKPCVINPSEDELRIVEEALFSDTLESLVVKEIIWTYLSEGVVSFDADTGELKVLGRTVYRAHDPFLFYTMFADRISFRLARIVYNELAEKYLSRVRDIIPLPFEDNKLSGSITVDGLRRRLGIRVPARLAGRAALIEVSLNPSDRVYRFKFDVYTVLPVTSKIGTYFEVPVESEDLEDTIKAKIEESLKVISDMEEGLDVFDRVLTSHGFERTDKLGLYTYKKGALELSVSVWTSADLSKDKPGFMAEIRAKYMKDVDENVLKNLLAEHGLSADTVKRGTTTTVSSIIKVSHGEAEEQAEKIVLLPEVFRKARRAVIPAKRHRARRTKNKGLEAFAKYLVFLADPGLVHDNPNSMLSDARRFIVKKTNLRLKDYVALLTDAGILLLNLIASGHITVENKKVQVFGHNLADLVGEEAAETVARELWNIVGESLSRMEPEEIKNIWQSLPVSIKKRYVELLSPKTVQRILFDQTLSASFRDYADVLIERALSSGDPEVATLVAYEYRPELFGPKKPSLLRTRGTVVVDAGLFYVQVYRAGRKGTDFIVYRKDTGIGVVYRAQSLAEAISKAIRTYDTLVLSARRRRAPLKKVGELKVVVAENAGDTHVELEVA